MDRKVILKVNEGVRCGLGGFDAVILDGLARGTAGV